jgi:hypothetical protein
MTDAHETPPAAPWRIPLNRRVAVLRPDRIDVRPSRRTVLGPLSGFLLGIGSALAIWFGMSVLPLPLLAVLLIVAVIAIPFAGLGTIYALIGAHVVIDRAKQSATWQQGFLGMGVGTTELVPFWKIDRIAVQEAGAAVPGQGRTVEEFAQWQIVLLKKSGKRLEIGTVSAARSLSRDALKRAREVATAIAEMSGAPLDLPGTKQPSVEAASLAGAAPGRSASGERRRNRRGRGAARRR